MTTSPSVPPRPLHEPMPSPSILDTQPDHLAEYLSSHRVPRFRLREVRDWVVKQRATAFEEMSSLPKELRAGLDEAFSIFTCEVDRHQVATDETEKLLVRWPDGEQIECVLMREQKRRTVCLSSQSGCAMGCVFCASGLEGLRRNLTAYEIIEQALLLRNLLSDDEHLTNVVMMGMGEPLANTRHLGVALDWLVSSDYGLGMSPRHITVSTVGIPGGISKFSEFGKPFQLAISLHASNNELRNEIVPVGRHLSFDELITEALDYQRDTGRQVTFEYVMLHQLNDRPEHARQLSKRLRNTKSHVNLIRYNRVDGLPYDEPLETDINEFADILRRSNVSVTIRKRKGEKIDAACGQLRLKERAS